MSLNVRNITQANITHALGEPEDTSTKDTVIGLLKRIHSSSTVNGETINDLIDEVDDLNEEIDNLKNQKADKVDVYTKQETDTLLQAKANNNAVYTTQQVDNLLTQKANQSTTYTKTEVDNSLSLKADKSTTYTKTEVNDTLALKADKSDTYTKTQVDNLIANNVTTNTLQIITGTKIFAEAHATDLYATNFILNTHKFSQSAFVSGDTSQENETLCSKKYIQNYVSNSLNISPINQITFSDATINFSVGFCKMSIVYGNNVGELLQFPCLFWKYNNLIFLNGSVILETSSATSGNLYINGFTFFAGSTYLNGVPFWSNGGSNTYDVGGEIFGYAYKSGDSKPNAFFVWIGANNLVHASVMGDITNQQTSFTLDGRWKLCFNNYKLKYDP